LIIIINLSQPPSLTSAAPVPCNYQKHISAISQETANVLGIKAALSAGVSSLEPLD
jgi:hypothetical protein